MTKPLSQRVPTTDLQPCWICGLPLEHYTDGDGRVYEGCPPCRIKIETMVRRLQLLDPRSHWELACRRRVYQPTVAPEPDGPPPVREIPPLVQMAQFVAEREGLPAAVRCTGLGYWGLRYRAKQGGWRLPDARRRG